MSYGENVVDFVAVAGAGAGASRHIQNGKIWSRIRPKWGWLRNNAYTVILPLYCMFGIPCFTCREQMIYLLPLENANKLLLFVIENNVSWKSFTRKHEFLNFLFEFNKTSRLSGNLESVI